MSDPKSVDKRLFQIIDANLNRSSEGLRVIEEMARFVMSDAALQRRVKILRHELNQLFSGENCQKLDRLSIIAEGRDSQSDVGRRCSTEKEMLREDFGAVLRANFSRIEESARVLEEYTKIISSEIGEEIKQLRFKIYTLEKDFISSYFSEQKNEEHN